MVANLNFGFDFTVCQVLFSDFQIKVTLTLKRLILLSEWENGILTIQNREAIHWQSALLDVLGELSILSEKYLLILRIWICIKFCSVLSLYFSPSVFLSDYSTVSSMYNVQVWMSSKTDMYIYYFFPFNLYSFITFINNKKKC